MARDADIRSWSEHQAALLRRVTGGEALSEAPYWSNIIEEVESVSRIETRACRSHLFQALLHDLKAEGWPLSRDEPHWRAEALNQRREAREAFSPLMRQPFDIATRCAACPTRSTERPRCH